MEVRAVLARKSRRVRKEKDTCRALGGGSPVVGARSACAATLEAELECRKGKTCTSNAHGLMSGRFLARNGYLHNISTWFPWQAASPYNRLHGYLLSFPPPSEGARELMRPWPGKVAGTAGASCPLGTTVSWRKWGIRRHLAGRAHPSNTPCPE